MERFVPYQMTARSRYLRWRKQAAGYSRLSDRRPKRSNYGCKGKVVGVIWFKADRQADDPVLQRNGIIFFGFSRGYGLSKCHQMVNGMGRAGEVMI